jgi:hypothetical protein
MIVHPYRGAPPPPPVELDVVPIRSTGFTASVR